MMTYDTFLKRYEFDTQDKRALLGTGGFASVYKAYDTVQKRHVAIKVAEVKHEKFNLQHEKQLVDELDSHENIVRYGNCYRFQFMPIRYDFAILKYYEDGNLNDVLKKYNLTLPQKHQIIKGILEGVAHLHRHHIIHRDLKPQNILMERQAKGWIPKLTDFGLSKLSGTDTHSIENSAIGLSIAYAAPEQIQARDIRPNVDLWAVGVCAYHLLVGELPFDASRTISQESWNIEISKLIVSGQIPAKINTVPEPYRTLIKKCLTVDNAKRPQKADELLRLLDEETKIEKVEDEQTKRVDHDLSVKEMLEKGNSHFEASLSMVGFLKEQALKEAVKYYEEVLKIDAQHTEAKRKLEKCRAELLAPALPFKKNNFKRYGAVTAVIGFILIGFYYWNWYTTGKEDMKWVKATFYSTIRYEDTARVYKEMFFRMNKYANTWLMDDTTNYALGLYYEEGRGGAIANIDKAIDFYEKVDDSYPDANYRIGYIFFKGLGNKMPDSEKAKKYFELAANNGVVIANNYLGLIYLEGNHKDFKLAKKYFETASSKNEKWGHYNLGYIYEHGYGVTASPSQAAYYYELAAKQGIPDARTALARVRPTTTSSYSSYNKPKNSAQKQPFAALDGWNAINSLLRKR